MVDKETSVDKMSKLKKLFEYDIKEPPVADAEQPKPTNQTNQVIAASNKLNNQLPMLPQLGDKSQVAINSLYANIRALPQESGPQYDKLLKLFIASL